MKKFEILTLGMPLSKDEDALLMFINTYKEKISFKRMLQLVAVEQFKDLQELLSKREAIRMKENSLALEDIERHFTLLEKMFYGL